jgi:regulator of protease activity HflC (stomatin/prohibitin superfamily)
MNRNILFGVLIVVIAGAVAGIVWLWMCYNWCGHGSSLQVTRKTGQPAEAGRYAQEDQQGVRKEMRGPGRHWLNPWDYSVREVRDVVIAPGQIATVKNNIGRDMPPDRFIAQPEEKGTQKRVLTPGVWRVNTFGQEVNVVPATIIKPGYVGVQTLREGPNKGVQPDVLQAGYYNINPVERRVDPVEIGYRVLDIRTDAETVADAKTGAARKRFTPGTGVSFPLADGKQMHLDFTVVWGIFPKDAPRIIREYGTVEMVEQKIIEPQVQSICKNAGSNLTTQEFIEGTTREKFQQEVTESLQAMGQQKGIHFLIALVRGFHPAEDIKATIQAKMLAEEEKITLKMEQQRDTVAAQLEEAQRRVQVAVTDFDAQTEALVQEEMEKGNKLAAETRAQADRKVAELQKSAAEINAQVITILGRADADVIEAKKKAEARRLELLISAYGGPDEYNLATFAESLPDDIQVEYRYAGEGTFWTDTKSSLIEMAARKALGKPAGKAEKKPREQDEAAPGR